MKQDQTVVDWQGNVLVKFETESYFFEWYYVYDEYEILKEDENWKLPFQQINKKSKCKYKIESDVLSEYLPEEVIYVWNIYQWKTVKSQDEINWEDQFEDGSLNGWVNITMNTDRPFIEDITSDMYDCINDFVDQNYRLNDRFKEEYDYNDIKEKRKLEVKDIIDQINLERFNLKKPKKYLSRKNRTYKHNAWATMVKEKDKNKCTNCDSVYNLEAHHIKSVKHFPELQYDINNGITLCKLCHTNHHKQNGYK